MSNSKISPFQEILKALNLPENPEYLSEEGIITEKALVDIRERVYRNFRILHTVQGILNDLTEHFDK